MGDEVVESHALMTSSRNNSNSSNLWHQRYGHLIFQYLSLLTKGRMVVGMPDIYEKKEIFVKQANNKDCPLMKEKLGETKVFWILFMVISTVL
jgi:hypothetical protein